MIVEFNTFASRLQKACETDEPAEIARLTELTYQTVKNYLLGRLPTADVLIKLSEKLGVSIHWLLTGFGPQFVEDLSTVVEFSFEQHERKVIAEIAKTLFAALRRLNLAVGFQPTEASAPGSPSRQRRLNSGVTT